MQICRSTDSVDHFPMERFNTRSWLLMSGSGSPKVTQESFINSGMANEDPCSCPCLLAINHACIGSASPKRETKSNSSMSLMKSCELAHLISEHNFKNDHCKFLYFCHMYSIGQNLRYWCKLHQKFCVRRRSSIV